MIVKTGANYQAQGGYIEAAIVDNKIVANVNDQTKEYPFYDTSVDSAVVVPITMGKSANAESVLISVTAYQRYDIENDSYVYDYKNVTLSTTPVTGNFAPTAPFGLFIRMPEGVIPKLGNGSKDCEMVKGLDTEVRFLIVTGPNPVAIIDVE